MRSTRILVFIAIFGCFMLYMNHSLTRSHNRNNATKGPTQFTPLSQLMEKRNEIMLRSYEYMSNFRSPGVIVQSFDYKLWRSTSQFNFNDQSHDNNHNSAMDDSTKPHDTTQVNSSSTFFVDHVNGPKNSKTILSEEEISNLALRNFSRLYALDTRLTHPTFIEEDEKTTVGECVASFPPSCEMNPYVRFWKKRFKDSDCRKSPLKMFRQLHRITAENSSSSISLNRFVVFQPDGGGWNNIRMAAETAMVFAIASGRTLVLPPNMTFYLLNKNGNAKLDTSSFANYFDLRKISELVDIITMPEFLHVFSLLNKSNSLPVGETVQSLGGRNRPLLWNYLENTCYTRDYHAGRMFFGFNVKLDKKSRTGVRFRPIARNNRLKKMASHDRQVVAYDAHMDSIPCIYFPGDYREKYRLLTHFYSFLFWANPLEERFHKRLVRDRLHYADVIFCAAGKVVHEILADSFRLGGAKNKDSPNYRYSCSGFRRFNRLDSIVGYETCHNLVTLGGDTRYGPTFFAMHIRRGDFQYGHTRISATEIWNNVQHLLNTSVSKLLYISTDEKNKSFFDPFREHFTIKFLTNYVDIAGLRPGRFNQNYLGMVEQIVCASAHTFIGTPLSTYTGYITRMRGYHRDGRYAHTFYFLRKPMHQLHTIPDLKGPFWSREFAVAHHDIDDDMIQ